MLTTVWGSSPQSNVWTTQARTGRQTLGSIYISCCEFSAAARNTWVMCDVTAHVVGRGRREAREIWSVGAETPVGVRSSYCERRRSYSMYCKIVGFEQKGNQPRTKSLSALCMVNDTGMGDAGSEVVSLALRNPAETKETKVPNEREGFCNFPSLVPLPPPSFRARRPPLPSPPQRSETHVGWASPLQAATMDPGRSREDELIHLRPVMIPRVANELSCCTILLFTAA